MSNRKKSAKHGAGVNTKVMNAQTKQESAGETSQTTGCCSELVKPLEERLYLPLTNRETWNLHHLVDEFHEEELEDRAGLLWEVSRALNLPEIAVLIAGSMTKAFTKGGATAENPA